MPVMMACFGMEPIAMVKFCFVVRYTVGWKVMMC